MSVDILLNLAATARLFHTSDGSAFADLVIDGHRETWRLRSKRFNAWLRQQYYERTWDAPAPAAMSAVLNVLEAQAQFDGPERNVSVRVAEYAGSIYLDLADEFWRCVEINPSGWRITEDVPVRFRRTAGMLALPLPLRGGSIAALAPFLNLANHDAFVLVVAWLLVALRPAGPFPLLALSGEQGSAKTVLSKLLRALIDPHAAPVRALPRNERELFITANNNHVLAFDNLSGLPAAVSDSFCRLASGGSYATRALYTNQDEVLFTAARPIILNGIDDAVIARPDLADRAIMLTLEPIAETQRRPEKTLWREFYLARPRILGALLDAVAHGLRNASGVRLQQLPRMADFAVCAAACENGIWEPGTFEAAFWRNRHTVIANIVDGDPVAACVRDIMSRQGQWTGNASDLLQVGASRSAGWPATPRALAGRLRRAQTFLRTLGIDIVFGREGRLGTRTIRMRATRRSHGSITRNSGETGTAVGTVRTAQLE